MGQLDDLALEGRALHAFGFNDGGRNLLLHGINYGLLSAQFDGVCLGPRMPVISVARNDGIRRTLTLFMLFEAYVLNMLLEL